MKKLNVGLFLLLHAIFIDAVLAEPALKEVFAGKFLFGTAVNPNQVAGSNPKETELILRHCNTITAENVLKWQLVHPEPKQYDFEQADQFVEFGEENDLFMVCHTLVWHNQTPDWVFQDEAKQLISRQALIERMKDHIFTVMGRYKGRVQSWDVVNEAIEDDGTLRKTKWLEIIGPDYIEMAFEFAAQADPNAKLYYNDYNMYKPAHCQRVIRLVKSLQAKGVRIDGIGTQAHWGMDYPTLQEIENSFNAFAKLNIPIMITEMDLTVLPIAWQQRGADITQDFKLRKELNPWPDGLPDEMQQKLADRYGEIFSLFNKYSDLLDRVTLWGFHDATSWRNNWPVKGRSDYPLLFDRQLKPKPAFFAVIKAVQEDEQNK